MKTIPAGKFKDRCLKILDEVYETRESVIVTKRGHPLAKLVPYRERQKPTKGLGGSILQEKGDPFSTGETWDADRS